MATKYPPALTLDEAIRVIKDIYKDHKGREISIDLMPSVLKVSPKSSYFGKQISTLQKMNLVDKKPNDQLELTDLAMQVVNAFNNKEAFEAKLEAIKKIDVMAALISRYPNFRLPSNDQLKEYLHKTFSISRDTVGRWAQYVTGAFNHLSSASPSTEEKTIGESADITISPSPAAAVTKTVSPTISYQESFGLPSNKKFMFTLEDGYTLQDLEFITDFFELKKKGIKNKMPEID